MKLQPVHNSIHKPSHNLPFNAFKSVDIKHKPLQTNKPQSHAGYTYSGPAAAWAYKSLNLTNCKRIFLLGPSHAWYLNDCALSTHTHYATPLGNLTLDQETIRTLNATGKFRSWLPQKETQEHSLEMHLPYLYKMCCRTFGQDNTANFPLLIPVLVGNVPPPRQGGKSEIARDEVAYGEIFAPYLQDPETVFVVSSDFCHWGDRFSYQDLMPEVVDKSAMAAIETGRHQAFADDLAETENTVCGRHPIGVMMAALEVWKRERGVEDGKGVFRFLRYERSGEIVSRRDSSVSYCSAVAILD